MKKILFLSISLLVSLFSYTTDFVYKEYYAKIYTADAHISDSNYVAALTIYKELVKQYPYHHYKYIHNACLCAINTGQYADAFMFAQRLIGQGYEMTDFETPAFEHFRQQKKYWKKFVSEYPTLKNQYEAQKDQALRKKYADLFVLDQEAANHSNKSEDKDCVLYDLSVTVSKIITEQGFPHFLLDKDSIRIKLYTMLRHYCGLKNRIRQDESLLKDCLSNDMSENKIDSLSKEALYRGLVLPQDYVGIVSHWDNSSPFGIVAATINYKDETIKVFLKNIPSNDYEQANLLRESIGLLPIDEKAINTSKYKNYPFKEIRQACEASDSCRTQKDCNVIIGEVVERVKKEAQKGEDQGSSNYFFKPDVGIRDTYYYGIWTLIPERNRAVKNTP